MKSNSVTTKLDAEGKMVLKRLAAKRKSTMIQLSKEFADIEKELGELLDKKRR